MKKKLLFICVALTAMICLITINIRLKYDDNRIITIKTYIDGKLAAAVPSSNDGYIVSSVTCTNNLKATFNYTTWRLETNNTTGNSVCTIHFVSNYNETFASYLENKICTSTPTSDEAAKDCLVNENGYRYEGSDPNNYVLFNNELWRIIGVFNVKNGSEIAQNLVKIIRDDNLDSYDWDKNGKNTWATATLQQHLNNGYLNKDEDATCYTNSSVSKNCKFGNTGINNISREKIEEVIWNIGGSTSSAVTAEAIYLSEGSAEWTGYVGLMSASDYGYAVLNSKCLRGTLLNSYNSTACAGNNWLFKNGFQWTLTPTSSNATQVFYINNNYQNKDGNRHVDVRVVTSGSNVRPVVYLKSSVNYVSGDGTYNNPYIIS